MNFTLLVFTLFLLVLNPSSGRLYFHRVIRQTPPFNPDDPNYLTVYPGYYNGYSSNGQPTFDNTGGYGNGYNPYNNGPINFEGARRKRKCQKIEPSTPSSDSTTPPPGYYNGYPSNNVGYENGYNPYANLPGSPQGQSKRKCSKHESSTTPSMESLIGNV